MLNQKLQIIQNYISNYNNFNVAGMIVDFDDSIVFENHTKGQIDLKLSSKGAFTDQANKILPFFSIRNQQIVAHKTEGNFVEIAVKYHAVLAIDLSPEMKTGQELKLTGKSIFTFNEFNKVIKLVDIS